MTPPRVNRVKLHCLPYRYQPIVQPLHEAQEQRNVVDDEEDDDEETDTKAKALTNLLKASSVYLRHFIHQL